MFDKEKIIEIIENKKNKITLKELAHNLNENGFVAGDGKKWSELKVSYFMRNNKIAKKKQIPRKQKKEIFNIISNLKFKKLSSSEIADELNMRGILTQQNNNWDYEKVYSFFNRGLRKFKRDNIIEENKEIKPEIKTTKEIAPIKI
jgi:hypothetical protein